MASPQAEEEVLHRHVDAASSVAVAARPTIAYGMTRNAAKGAPSSAMLATASTGLVIQVAARIAMCSASASRKPSPRRSGGRAPAALPTTSVTDDAKVIPRAHARAPSL